MAIYCEKVKCFCRLFRLWINFFSLSRLLAPILHSSLCYGLFLWMLYILDVCFHSWHFIHLILQCIYAQHWSALDFWFFFSSFSIPFFCCCWCGGRVGLFAISKSYLRDSTTSFWNIVKSFLDECGFNGNFFDYGNFDSRVGSLFRTKEIRCGGVK